MAKRYEVILSDCCAGTVDDVDIARYLIALGVAKGHVIVRERVELQPSAVKEVCVNVVFHAPVTSPPEDLERYVAGLLAERGTAAPPHSVALADSGERVKLGAAEEVRKYTVVAHVEVAVDPYSDFDQSLARENVEFAVNCAMDDVLAKTRYLRSYDVEVTS